MRTRTRADRGLPIGLHGLEPVRDPGAGALAMRKILAEQRSAARRFPPRSIALTRIVSTDSETPGLSGVAP
jgi:hypothetical protein